MREALTSHFPDTPILLSVGNNDIPIHDNSPYVDIKDDYYEFVHKTYFKDHPGNADFADSIEQTFKLGGYYRYDLSDKVTVLSLNTLAYNVD